MRSCYDWLRGHPLMVNSVLALLLIFFGVSIGSGLRQVGVVEGVLFVAGISAPVALRRRRPLLAVITAKVLTLGI